MPRIESEHQLCATAVAGGTWYQKAAAAILVLEEQSVSFEAWVPALYPFMDVPALVLAIVLANAHRKKQDQGSAGTGGLLKIVKDSLQGPALSALVLGLVLGLVARPDRALESFYDPLFRGLLSVLMLVLGMEAFSRLRELSRVAHWFILYAFVAPIVHGAIGFAFGYAAHVLVGFSPGGVVLFSVIAASNSDISGLPTLRAGIPGANPSAYVGASTSVGTPVAIAVCIPLFSSLAQLVLEM